jgi:hypothetical protein
MLVQNVIVVGISITANGFGLAIRWRLITQKFNLNIKYNE